MIYLDNAATSLPKPETVPAAVLERCTPWPPGPRGACARPARRRVLL
jgi:hypothetical protein